MSHALILFTRVTINTVISLLQAEGNEADDEEYVSLLGKIQKMLHLTGAEQEQAPPSKVKFAVRCHSHSACFRPAPVLQILTEQ